MNEDDALVQAELIPEQIDDAELEEQIESSFPTKLPARTRPKDFVAQVDPKEINQGLDNLPPDELLTFLGADSKTYTETKRAHRAFLDYLQMGQGRSIVALAKRYFEEHPPDWKENTYFTIERALKTYSSKYNWQQRVRDKMTKVSATALAKAQREAALNARYRINLAQLAQKAGALIILKANLHHLDEDSARKLLKPAAAMLKIGFESERAEAGESLAKITPNTPIDQMTDEELQAYIDTMIQELG